MMTITKHIVRAIVLGFVGTTLAFAHPTDPGVGSLANVPEMQQEKLAFVRYRVARATAERNAAQSITLADDEEMRLERLLHKAFRIADRRADLAD